MRVTGFDTLPWAALVEVLDGDMVNVPAGLRTARVAAGEMLL